MSGTTFTEEELRGAVALMRTIGKDTQIFEVKSAKKALPKNTAETVSAFSNGSGGTIICGLSEKDGFAPVDGFDARRIQDSLAELCNNKLTPPVRPDIAILPFEDATVVVATIREMLPIYKPCYVTASGKYNGSFIRTGDGDQRLSEYEIDRLLDEHRQPRFDGEIVPDATMDDFNADLLSGIIARERFVHPRNFTQLDDEQAVQLLNIAKKDDAGVLRPTMAGLLALGSYPQQFFPRLNVSFASYPGASKSEVTSAGCRLLDSVTVVGPIPYMIADTVATVRKNMLNGAMVNGAFRKDVPEYPIVALREAVANALMHRDYSPQALGTPVHVDMFADRIEISNPGGLYGTITVNLLGKEHGSSSRNQFLAAILESTPTADGGFVAENRGTGYKVIEAELEAALMPAPVPKNSISFFSLTFLKRRATKTERGLSADRSVRVVALNLLSKQESITTSDVVKESGRSKTTVVKYINQMIGEGVLEPVATGSSSRQRYRLAIV